MKNLILLACAVLFFGCGKKENTDFYHCTYVAGNGLKSVEDIKKSNWGQFDFLYMVASPKWTAEDFDAPYETIYANYIETQSYPNGDTGRALVPVAIAEAQAQGSKVVLSFAEGDYKAVAVDSLRRDKYARMMVDFAMKNNYDGIELDWEHTVTIPLHNLFLRDIRKYLDQAEELVDKKLYLTTALNASHTYNQAQADSAQKYADWINIMCYDYGGGVWGKKATHNTPFASIKKAIAKYDIFDPKKISFGMASYSYFYENLMPGVTIDSTKTLRDFGRYGNAVELEQYMKEGWVKSFDSVEQVYYFFSPDSTKFMTCETVETAVDKAQWAIDKNYQGIFWWVWGSDFVPATGDQKYGKHLLMDPVHETILNHRKK